MRAVVVSEFVDFDQASLGELPSPVPGEAEVVVDLSVSDTNFPDILYIEGKYQKLPAFPFSPGLAGAGVISRVGEGVDASRKGERVLVLPYHGTYAQQAVAPANFCFPIPDGISDEVAAALGLVYQSAYFALVENGQFQAGDDVLVLGATGGIGMAAVQLAKAMGAKRVIAASRGESGGELALQLGADVVVDSSAVDLRETLRDTVLNVTDGVGVSLVIDPVGGSTAKAALRALAWHGRYVVVGFASGEIPQFAGNYLLVKNISVTGVQWTDYRARQIEKVARAQQHIFDLCLTGKLNPLISEVYPLEQFAVALTALKTANARGKILLKV